MEIALAIMIVQGLLGAFDTLYYHEIVCRLPVYGPKVGGELRLHATRDFVYGTLFLTLPFVTWQGWLSLILVFLIGFEIAITIWDFNTEAVEREAIGGVANSERGLHLIMAVIYGVFLARLAPEVWQWFYLPTGFGFQKSVANWQVFVCLTFGIGVIMSGVRDLGASFGMRHFQFDILGRPVPER
jgi:hypothetical protein